MWVCYLYMKKIAVKRQIFLYYFFRSHMKFVRTTCFWKTLPPPCNLYILWRFIFVYVFFMFIFFNNFRLYVKLYIVSMCGVLYINKSIFTLFILACFIKIWDNYLHLIFFYLMFSIFVVYYYVVRVGHLGRACTFPFLGAKSLKIVACSRFYLSSCQIIFCRLSTKRNKPSFINPPLILWFICGMS